MRRRRHCLAALGGETIAVDFFVIQIDFTMVHFAYQDAAGEKTGISVVETANRFQDVGLQAILSGVWVIGPGI
jgi:hypothetical protein